MASDLLTTAFPNLLVDGYQPTSDASSAYNCIAWAAGDQSVNWWPDSRFAGYWPGECRRQETPDAFADMFTFLGYQLCDSQELESGFEKVALYCLNGKPTHAARQLPDGKWTSKLGKNIDISHTLPGLEGDVYGAVWCVMKRARDHRATDPPHLPA